MFAVNISLLSGRDKMKDGDFKLRFEDSIPKSKIPKGN